MSTTLNAPVEVKNEKPILFSGEMVKAILAGTKTQTRRIMKYKPQMDGTKFHHLDQFGTAVFTDGVCVYSPYGIPGDRLWVKETHIRRGDSAIYKADLDAVEAAGVGAMYGGWKPSIFCKRIHSRITLEITEVRVQRLHEIGKDGRHAKDVLAEGITDAQIEHWRKWLHPDDAPAHT
jgi:hypothetical protein